MYHKYGGLVGLCIINMGGWLAYVSFYFTPINSPAALTIRMEVASSRPDYLPTLSAAKTSKLSLLVKHHISEILSRANCNNNNIRKLYFPVSDICSMSGTVIFLLLSRFTIKLGRYFNVLHLVYKNYVYIYIYICICVRIIKRVNEAYEGFSVLDFS